MREIDAGRADQRLDARLDQAGRRGRGDGSDVLGQAIALRRIEAGEALEERDRGGGGGGLSRAALLVVSFPTGGFIILL